MNLFLIACILTATGTAVAVIAFAAICIAAKYPYTATAADCAIVLGTKMLPNGMPTVTMQNRVNTAAQAYKNGMVRCLILCGGLAECYGGISEAQAMKNALLTEGIPDEAMLQDELSVDTEDNLLKARCIMEKTHLKTAIIVTSDYHMARALRLAKDMHIPACGIAALSPTGIGFWKARLRELLGWGLYSRNKLFRTLGIKTCMRAR